MSAVSLREKRLVIVTILVLLYAVVGFTARKRLDGWQTLRVETEAARSDYQLRSALIAAGPKWKKDFLEVQSLMPRFAATTRVDTHWLKILDDAAAVSGITIGSRQVSRETLVGDVYEISIQCNDWKGTLDQLVHFLYELHRAGAMLDVRTLFIRPDSKNPANLSGQFTLYCAFMRETTPATGTTP